MTKPICLLKFFVLSVRSPTEGQVVVFDKKWKSRFGAALSAITSPFSTLIKSSPHVVGLIFS